MEAYDNAGSLCSAYRTIDFTAVMCTHLLLPTLALHAVVVRISVTGLQDLLSSRIELAVSVLRILSRSDT